MELTGEVQVDAKRWSTTVDGLVGVGVFVGVWDGVCVWIWVCVVVCDGVIVCVGVNVGDAVKVGVTLGVGVGVKAITSPSIHPSVSSILITKLDSEYGAGTINW